MKILSMTATFGKLSHQTLTLEPGLNVIHAPNEWGKSTWCAFIVAMLYGIDTKERTTATALADKERYAPWSGAPMAGRMDICWNGRNITLERSTKGRVPFGEFRAYETDSGLPIQELTAANCGQALLGVEKSVFIKSGFVRLTDMPVVQDEALRRRLNALVTTGDESGTGDALAQTLRDLKNKCRHNKTGLLPQAEAQRDALKQKLDRLQELQDIAIRIRQRQQENEQQIQLLQNHKQMLSYQASLQDAHKVLAAEEASREAQQAYEQQKAYCQMLPATETAQESITKLEQVRIDQAQLQEESLPPIPEKPETPAIFLGMTPKQALMQAQSSVETYNILEKPPSPLLLILGILALAATIPVAIFLEKTVSLILLVVGALLAALHIRASNQQKRELQLLAARYQNIAPEKWVAMAQDYCDKATLYEQQEVAYRDALNSRKERKEQLQKIINSLTDGHTIGDRIDHWQKIIAAHEQLTSAHQKCIQAQQHAQALKEVAKILPKPEVEDTLTYSLDETDQFLAQYAADQHHLQLQLGQCAGQIETLGQESTLTNQLQTVEKRIAQLEDIYSALTIAIETLADAANELQRRFAPKISSRAQALFEKLTDGRYDRLQLTQDLSLNAAAQGEDALQAARWRSDGTVDQLYLALRLAVAGELTPDAPLVLDDALVRFDDVRLAAAMDILKEETASKQVILFSCQSRELEYL